MKRHPHAVSLAVCLVALVGLAVVGCTSGGTTSGSAGTSSGGTTSGGGAATIVEKNFAFNPSTLTVNIGDTVTFQNEDSAAHEVSINGQDLGKQAPGQSVTWTASTAGTFPFSCLIHPSMTGRVTVGSGGGSSAPPAGGTGGGSAPPAGGGYGY